MPDNILEKIIKKKIERIDLLKKSISLKSLDEKIDQNRLFINFKDKIQKNIDNNKISLIAEIKKASPSAGIIIEDYDPIEIAKIYYNNKATCLSILTEENFFLGNLIHVSKVKEKINLPVLCKDFFIDKFQVHLAKSYGADAILIIIAGVSDELANDLYEEALKLNMSIIVEVHTVEEAKKALNFKDKIQNNIDNNKISLIAEIKKASPSAGIIIDDYNPIEIAKIYNNNKATCLSILTEENFFLGSLSDISKVKEKINLPVLCKDFFIDKFQVPLAKSYGADAILIILAGVSDDLANELYEEAMRLNMSIIVEVHTIEEAEKALNFKEALIGINNRNLKTLKTDLNTTYDIYNVLSNHSSPLISESGIKTKEELLSLENKTEIKTFLIGESLLKNLNKNSIFSVL